MRSKNRPLKTKLVAVWCLAFLLLCSGTALAGPQDEHLLQSPANEKYTVQLGTFKTVPAMNDLFLQVPPKNLKKTLVCRSGVHYTLRCGSSAKKKDISPVFKEFNDLGLKPVIVKVDLSV